MDADAEITLLDLASGVLAGWEEGLLPQLHPSEQARYSAFTHAPRRQNWLAGRALLIAALTRTLGRIEPAALRTVDTGGVHYEHADLHLNLSHSANLLAAVLSPRPVGIDLERVRLRPSVRQAGRVFTQAEGARLHALSEAERLEGFYVLWTLKEAACKAAGLSLWEGLSHARFDTDAGRAELDGPFPNGRWAFLHAGVEPDWRLAVAVQGVAPELRVTCGRLSGKDGWHTARLLRPACLYAG